MPQDAATPRQFDHLDLEVQSFALCEVAEGNRLVGAAVDAVTAFVVLAGELHLTVSDGRAWVAPAGWLLVLPAGLDPVIAPAPGPARDVTATREILRRRGALLTFDAAEGKEARLRVLVGRVVGASAAALPDLRRNLRDHELARACLAALRLEVDAPGPTGGALIRALMTASIAVAMRRSAAMGAAPAEPRPDNRLAPALAAIAARPGDRYSVPQLADLAGMSRATFARHFTAALGMTPMEHVLAVRLREAAALLRGTVLPISQVAANTGFTSRTHFSRAFRTAYGTEPSRFRDEGAARHAASDARGPK